MATARPVVSVYQYDNPKEKTGTTRMPTVMSMPLRPDIVRSVHKNLAKNKRMPYAPKMKAGYETAAESWGTGRAVSRIPRVPGGGTSRSGQGAFGNMCRGGSMSHPNRIWRRWNRRVNLKERRTAVVSCLAASALPPLVMAHGHRIGEVAELPLVISDGAQSMTKTKSAVDVLKKLGLSEELQRILDSRKVRTGRGKLRNRRHVMRKGPLIIYAEDNGITRAVANIPGVECADVHKLGIMDLAPGGQFGRFLIWTEAAFKLMDKMYGKKRTALGAPMKLHYSLPRSVMENADVARIINSDEVQSVLRPKLEAQKKAAPRRNALTNKKAMAKLNPAYKMIVESRKKARQEGTPEHKLVQAQKKARLESKKQHRKEHKKGDDTFYKKLMKAFETKAAAADDAKEDEEEADA